MCLLPCSALQVAHTAEVLSPLGALYYNTGRHKEALEVYREAVSLQPSQRDLRLALVSRGRGSGPGVSAASEVKGRRCSRAEM